jgi:hypothetical protein
VQFYALFIVLMIVVLGISRLWPSGWWLLMAAVFLLGAVFLGLTSRRPAEEIAGAEAAENDR